MIDRGTYRETRACTGTAGDKLEHYVPCNRRAKPGAGIVFVAEALTNCEALAVEYVDTEGFVVSVLTTAAGGTYTVEFAWEAETGEATGNGKIKAKLKDKIKASKGG
jgi:hypothetical protein